MKNKPYPKYKPSGVEWLGDVPEHWEVTLVKFVCRFAYGDSLPAEDREDGAYHVYGSNGAVGTHYKPNTLAPVIVVGRKGSYGKLNFSPGPIFAIDTTYFIDRRFTQNSLEWLKYSLLPLKLDIGSKDSAVPGLAREDAYVNKFPLPPLAEQQAIAAFLDRETGRIDALIAKKERLLELLAEQRTALISESVTGKNLVAILKINPQITQKNADKNENHLRKSAKSADKISYKPSGVEWLGAVPEHWEALPLKRIVAIPVTDGPHETPEILDEGIPFVSAESIRNNKIDFNKKRGFISESEHRRFCLKYHPKRDDIYMIKSGATTGNLAIVDTDEEFSIWSPLAVIRVHREKADAIFVLAAMNSKEFQTSVQLFWSFGTQQNIGMNVIENLLIPLPPLPEQQAIAAFLDRETAKIDALSAKVTTMIERLQEYRTALISSAVTGKIDVRSAV
ncbi:MAG: restriction endonuclease subunit S [Deltaproteobacteria bacterium]|nr:restriction endonuclease subunit S [Deltaproteobacteria bacterium]